MDQRPTPGEVWDQLLASTLTTINSPPTTPKPFGLVKLSLNPRAKPIHLPRLSRTVTAIDPSLRTQIRALVQGEAPWPLFLHGPAGTGKTCAALCLLDLVAGEYHTVGGLCDLLIQSQQGRLEWHHEGFGGTIWPEKLWARVASAPLVVLDEMGCRDRVSDAHYEAVKRCVDERLGKPFVVVSNLAVKFLESLYDDRLASRLASGTVLELAGKDRRLSP